MRTFGIDFDMELLNGDSRDDVESGGFNFNTNAMKGDSLMRGYLLSGPYPAKWVLSVRGF